MTGGERLPRVAALTAKVSAASNAGGLLCAYAIRLGSQAAAFVLVARSLGPRDFGTYAAAAALVALLAPFVEAGAYSVTVRDTARGVPLAGSLSSSLAASAVLLPPAVLVLCLLKPLFLPAVPWTVPLSCAAAAFVGGRSLAICRGIVVGRQRAARLVLLEAVVGAAYLGTATLFVILDGDLLGWSLLYAAQSLIVGFVAGGWLMLRHRVSRPAVAGLSGRVREGLHFAAGLAAQSGYSDLDKAMLARLGGFVDAGIYAAAHRILTVGLGSLAAMLASIYPRFFRIGAAGYAAARGYAWRLTPLVLAYGGGAALALWMGGPYVVALLGDGYHHASEAIELLAWLLVIQAAQYPFADALTCSGRQPLRTAGQATALLVSIVTNLVLIPRLGWLGAAYGAIATQSFLLVFLVLAPSMRPAAPVAPLIAVDR